MRRLFRPLSRVHPQRRCDDRSLSQPWPSSTFHVFPVGYTWRSGHGTTARVDFILGDLCLVADGLVESADSPDVPLSFAASEDHRLVRAMLRLPIPEAVSGEARLRRKKQVAKYNLSSLERRAYFEQTMWQYVSPSGASLDHHAAHFTEFTHSAALSAFGSRADGPKQPWISESTWSVLKYLAPIRRSSFGMFKAANVERLRLIVVAWASTVRRVFSRREQ